MALEMVLTLANVFGIDIPKSLPNYQETIMPSNVSTSREMVDRVWARM